VNGSAGVSGMKALVHHHVEQGETCRQHSHPHFISLRLGALFFNHLKRVGSEDLLAAEVHPRLRQVS